MQANQIAQILLSKKAVHNASQFEGVQVRKLFEPNLFPPVTINDTVHNSTKFFKVIDKYFGKTRNYSQVCAVGFEPNPVHEPLLLKTAEAYNNCGWRVLFHTRTGVAEEKIFFRIFIPVFH